MSAATSTSQRCHIQLSNSEAGKVEPTTLLLYGRDEEERRFSPFAVTPTSLAANARALLRAGAALLEWPGQRYT